MLLKKAHHNKKLIFLPEGLDAYRVNCLDAPMSIQPSAFSPRLQAKIDSMWAKRQAVSLGRITLSSPLILAPMAGICAPPFRLLMQDLGAGGTVSELVSGKGISYQNDKTLKMLRIDPRERMTGLQLFGDEAQNLAEAAKVAQDFGAKFVDLNMGCPVRKVVSKGGGSALLQKSPSEWGHLFREIKKAISIPLTIKIRIGWDSENLNVPEVLKVAKEEGIEVVAVHGCTRTQLYKGQANWDYVESLAELNLLPLVGNGDLHTSALLHERLKITKCQALMLGRGPLHRPFLFLEGLDPSAIRFTAFDYAEVIGRYFHYLQEFHDQEKIILMQLKKQIVWMASSFPSAASFRQRIFGHCSTPGKALEFSQEYFESVGDLTKDWHLQHTSLGQN
ncbi:MAG: tRNA-dihydrouridine synthase [Pseudomonadota bacterium]